MLEIKYREFVKNLKKESPVPCDLKVGDKVTFTNDNGVSFSNLTVIGFADDDSFYNRFIHLDSDCYWFPVKLESLVKEN